MIKVLMVLWGATTTGAGATSEIITLDQCNYVKEQAKAFQVFCYPLDKPKQSFQKKEKGKLKP